MEEVKIVQKDFVTHTIFMVGPEGRAFPEANYQIAQGWEALGLLCESSEMEMRFIAEARDAKKEKIHHGR